ncbi:hypothetical protein TNCV_922721 [Trichonephila clavipes]|nr:hypothetical protein TNCV_922721 [Trichonephila clavipes]
MRLSYLTEKGDTFPRLERGIVPINIVVSGVLLGFPALGDVIDRETNGSNHLAALLENRRLKHLQKGPVSRIDLRKIIVKFEDTGDLDVLPKRGRKPVGTESVGEVATSVVENAPGSLYSSTSGRSVSRELEIP